jgi:membrane-associated PAP2 superfamily phosphatase
LEGSCGASFAIADFGAISYCFFAYLVNIARSASFAILALFLRVYPVTPRWTSIAYSGCLVLDRTAFALFRLSAAFSGLFFITCYQIRDLKFGFFDALDFFLFRLVETLVTENAFCRILFTIAASYFA